MSVVLAPKRLKYFLTTTLCARPSTSDARSRWSPAITCIEAVGNVENPVELRQRIVQIGYQK
jgi:hypothetical protein